jgi:hypothetical protein
LAVFVWLGYIPAHTMNAPMLKAIAVFLTVWSVRAESRAEISPTNHPFAGIAWFAETRTNPPTRLFVAEVDLTNPRIQFHVARGGPDPDGPGEWQTTLMQPTKIAAREKFDLVVNGDFFKARGVNDAEGANSGYRASIWAEGPAATGGNAWAMRTNSRPCLVVNKAGNVSLEQLARPRPGDSEVISGNTMLVQGGVPVVHQNNKTRHPRTAVGLNAGRTKMILLVVDGRKPGVAVGMNYDELAAEMIRLGCRDALNLDGGGSSVMAIREAGTEKFQILNQPTDGRERAVANVLGVVINNSTNQ